MISTKRTASRTWVILTLLGLWVSVTADRIGAGERISIRSDASNFRGELGSVIQRTLRAAKYEISPVNTQSGSAARFSARNPAQRMQAEFSAEGVVVQPWGSSDGNPWVFALRLESVGYEGDPMPVDDAVLVTQGNAIEYHRGNIVEWYINDDCGLEQGFTILEAPNKKAGSSVSSRLEVQLEVTGSLIAELADGGSAVLLHNESGDVVARVKDLFAYDASNRGLHSSFDLNGLQLVLRVDAFDARYPLTIDPMIVTEQDKLLADDAAANDQLGTSVAMSGDTALVSAPYDDGAAGTDQGSAYVFVRSGMSWDQQAKLTADDSAVSDQFGTSVAMSGDTAVVGAELDDHATDFDQGSAYVFVRIGTAWTQQAKLTASDAAIADHFGKSVAMSGDTVVVGAPWDDISGPSVDRGAAYVFVRTGATTWTQQAKLLPSDGAAFDEFGSSVAISDNTIVVGAPFDNGAGGFDQGSAYVFVRSGTVWSQQAKLLANDAGAFDQLGFAVSISGDTAVVGANAADLGIDDNTGAVYVFVRSGTTWTQQSRLTPSDPLLGDNIGFGNSVSFAGNTVVIGAPNHNGTPGMDEGAAYLFIRSGVTWANETRITASDDEVNAVFGSVVALDGLTVCVGAPRKEANDAGAAYIFILPFPCATDADCLDANACTCNQCVAGACLNAPSAYGDLVCNGSVDVDDILYVLSGFSDSLNYPASDIEPCGGDGDVDVDDILAMLDAFAGGEPCGC